MTAYYNEFDPYAAQWLRNLIGAGHIAPGVVDERSITELDPDELRQYKQCHFFAGIGVWSYALRNAGWPDDRPVWTGSCPCQPFSAAGKRKGADDERHLAPVWLRLIRECRPSVVFGEQVGAAIGIGWLDALFVEMEEAGYACGAVDFSAASVGAPHIRSRVYFVADADSYHGRSTGKQSNTGTDRRGFIGRGGEVGGMAYSERERGRGGKSWGENAGNAGKSVQVGATNGFWSSAEWINCIDGKARPTEPGTFPLVNGASQRVGRLRAYGNAIVAPQATAFIGAYMDD